MQRWTVGVTALAGLLAAAILPAVAAQAMSAPSETAENTSAQAADGRRGRQPGSDGDSRDEAVA